MNLLSLAVLLSCVVLFHGEELLSDECRLEMLARSYEADYCFHRLGSPQQLISEFNQTIRYYSGNNVDYHHIEILLNKICRILPHYYECALKVFDVVAECPSNQKADLRKFVLDELAAFSDYACENNGELVKNLIPHNGLKFFFLNDDFMVCTAILNELENINDLCSALDRAYSCAEDVIGDHPNKSIILFAREITSQFKQMAKC